MPMFKRGFLVLLLILASACSSTSPSANGVVLYQITGTAKDVAVTYADSGENIVQTNSPLPFKYTWSTAKAGDFLYISAQIDTSPDAGSITVTISKNGIVAYTGTAIGFNNIGTAMGTF